MRRFLMTVNTPIFKAPRRYAKLRELSRVYGLLRQDVVRTKNRLKSTYRRRGIDCSGTAVYDAKRRTKWERQLPAAARPAAELLGISLDCLEELKSEAEVAMVTESRRYRVARILRTVPGLGPVRVAQMLPIVVTPHRFRTKRQFWSYCGLGIVMKSSADWLQVKGQWVKARVAQSRGLNRNFNRTLKVVFKGAATTVLRHCGPNRFQSSYERLCDQGTKPNLAKVTVARQIAATTLAIWKSEKEYHEEM